MGFYIRKSLTVGPARFNLSSSGIGISVGIKGLRIGTGPRGTYIHAGRGGVYYRQYLSAPGRIAPRSVHTSVSRDDQHPCEHDGGEVNIESAPTSKMNDSSAAAILNEIREKRAMVRWAPIFAIFLLVIIFLAWANSSSVGSITLLISFAVVIAVSRYDKQRTAVIAMYDLEPDDEMRFKALYDSIIGLRKYDGVWSVTSTEAITDYRYHAGATKALKRQRVVIGDRRVPFLHTNISVPSLILHNLCLYFLPDRIYVSDAAGIGAVSYIDFYVRVSSTRFIEDGAVARDATRVGYTWQYVNKNGSRDRRFAFNRQLPICAYQELFFTSQSGIRAYVQISNPHGADIFLQALSAMHSHVTTLPSYRYSGYNYPAMPPPPGITPKQMQREWDLYEKAMRGE